MWVLRDWNMVRVWTDDGYMLFCLACLVTSLSSRILFLWENASQGKRTIGNALLEHNPFVG